MLFPGQTLSIAIEKPAAGGRMIARVDGQVVLVGGAIPGERVTARVERVAKGVAYAETVTVDEPSSDRREPVADLRCGGCSFAHIGYSRQLEIKAQIIADAFTRIGRLAWTTAIPVAASAEEGYRMRARLHLRGGRFGFFREGTHDICDARSTRQLLPATADALDRVVTALEPLRLTSAIELELSENIDASQRVVCAEAAHAPDARSLRSLSPIDGLTGLAVGGGSPAGARVKVLHGSEYVTDTLAIGDRPAIALRRHVLAFFQGNRYLLRELVAHVVDQVVPGGDVIDLYAGAGLFAVAVGVARGARVTAVEGDPLAAADLAANATASGAAMTVVQQPVEAFTAAFSGVVRTAIVDPPRTGMSREALDGIIRLKAARVIVVSCDVATLARDARRLVESGYTIERVEAFDLFPNTPHVETVMVFGAK